jgi:hypothetical protein
MADLKWDDRNYVRTFLLAFEGHDNTRIAEVLGISKETFYQGLKKRPAFQDALDQGRSRGRSTRPFDDYDLDLLDARRWALNHDFHARGTASAVIEPFAVLPGEVVCVVSRVSTYTQDHAGNLGDQAADLAGAVYSAGGDLAGVYRHVGSGWDISWIDGAVKLAFERGATILLAASTDRFVRHPAYRSRTNYRAQALDWQLYELRRRARGLRLMTHLHPDATPEEVALFHSQRGQRLRGSGTGGRPRKVDDGPGHRDRRHRLLMPRVRELLAEDPFRPLREIADALNREFGDRVKPVDYTTVWRWIDEDRGAVR